jgi:H+/Cl- antiporter ClcA
MNHQTKQFLIKFAIILIMTPFIGYALMRYFEYFEKVWKSNNRRNKWLATCGFFIVLAALAGWFQ